MVMAFQLFHSQSRLKRQILSAFQWRDSVSAKWSGSTIGCSYELRLWRRAARGRHVASAWYVWQGYVFGVVANASRPGEGLQRSRLHWLHSPSSAYVISVYQKPLVCIRGRKADLNASSKLLRLNEYFTRTFVPPNAMDLRQCDILAVEALHSSMYEK